MPAIASDEAIQFNNNSGASTAKTTGSSVCAPPPLIRRCAQPQPTPPILDSPPPPLLDRHYRCILDLSSLHMPGSPKIEAAASSFTPQKPDWNVTTPAIKAEGARRQTLAEERAPFPAVLNAYLLIDSWLDLALCCSWSICSTHDRTANNNQSRTD